MDQQDRDFIQGFVGFRKPTTTAVPDEIFDVLLPDLTGAELKVLIYICRRTFGFKKDSDRISLKQIANGIIRRDGTVLDRGTGLSRRHIQRAIASLEEKNAIKTERTIDEDGQNEINVYSLKFLEEEDYYGRGVGTLSPYGRDKKSPGVGTPVSPTTNSKQQTVYKTVNRSIKNPIQSLPVIKQPEAKTKDIAGQILERLGEKDSHSKKFHYLVASRIPEKVIKINLSEVIADRAKNPSKLFTFRMKKYAEEELASQHSNWSNMRQKMARNMRV